MHDPYAALRFANYRWLILGHGALTVAREGQIVVVGWQVYEQTRRGWKSCALRRRPALC